MDFELATMLAESGLTFQEFNKRGLTKSQLRLTLAKDQGDVDQEARQDSVPFDKHEPSPVRPAPRNTHVIQSPASVAPLAVPMTPREPELLSAELTVESAAMVLLEMSRESRSPQTAKRQRVDNEYGYTYAEGPSDSYGYGEGPPYPYYQQPAHPIGHGYAPQPGYQAYHAYQHYAYQQQPHQNEYHYGYNPNYMHHPEYAGVAHHGVHPQYHAAHEGQTPSHCQIPPVAVAENQYADPSPPFLNVKAGKTVVPSTALVSSGKINIQIPGDSNRTHEQTWLNHFNSLQEYLTEHREYPTHSKAHPSMLGQWCGRQRKHYRRVGPYRNGNPMPAHRIELMELLPGWRWEGAPGHISKKWTPLPRLNLPESSWSGMTL